MENPAQAANYGIWCLVGLSCLVVCCWSKMVYQRMKKTCSKTTNGEQIQSPASQMFLLLWHFRRSQQCLRLSRFSLYRCSVLLLYCMSTIISLVLEFQQKHDLIHKHNRELNEQRKSSVWAMRLSFRKDLCDAEA